MTQRQLIKGVFSPPTTTTIGPNLTQLSLRSQKCLGGCPGRSPADNPTCHQFTHHLSVHRWTIWLTVFHSTMTHVFQFIYQCLGFVWTLWENPTPHDWEHHCVPKPVSGGGSYRSWESPIYIIIYIYIYLVGGFNPSEKYDFVSWYCIIISNLWKVRIQPCSKAPTSICMLNTNEFVCLYPQGPSIPKRPAQFAAPLARFAQGAHLWEASMTWEIPEVNGTVAG